MYEKVKKIVKKIVPKSLVRGNTKTLRKIVAAFYTGSSYECGICHFQMSRFILLENGNKLCPKCGSLPRSRRLCSVMQSEVGIENKTILHFSPPKSLSERIKKAGPLSYISADYSGEFPASEKIDITSIDKSDESFDLIICFHVLEHVLDDEQAMREMHRITKKGGLCLIQTPFKEGNTYEDASIILPEERRIHFGQEDHVRIYSVQDLMKKLIAAGFNVVERIFEANEGNRMGFSNNETILFAYKK